MAEKNAKRQKPLKIEGDFLEVLKVSGEPDKKDKPKDYMSIAKKTYIQNLENFEAGTNLLVPGSDAMVWITDLIMMINHFNVEPSMHKISLLEMLQGYKSRLKKAGPDFRSQCNKLKIELLEYKSLISGQNVEVTVK